MLECRYCGQQWKNKNALAQHEIRCNKNPNHIKVKLYSVSEPLTDFEKSVFPHYYYLYQEIYKRFKDEAYTTYVSSGLRKFDAMILAKKDALHRVIDIDNEKQQELGVWKCPVCGLYMKDMCSHVVKVHKITWEQFVKQYNWTQSKVQFLNSHKAALRQNKLDYYNGTDEGLAARLELKEKYKGDSNPAKRWDVRVKISQSCKGRHLTSHQKECVSSCTTSGLYSNNSISYGYTFWEFSNNKEIRFRSKCEYLVYLMFCYYGFDAQHEPYKIAYNDPDAGYTRHYIVDYVCNNRLFEVKPFDVDFSNDKKYNLIQKQLSKFNKKLEVLTPDNFVQVMGVAADNVLPVSFFEDILIENVRTGQCKLKFPTCHDVSFYASSSFVKKIGGLDVIKTGELLYENKKCD